MREVTFEEMDEVAGGNLLLGIVGGVYANTATNIIMDPVGFMNWYHSLPAPQKMAFSVIHGIPGALAYCVSQAIHLY